MKFILVDHTAATEIVSDRLLQVPRFTQGAKLAEALRTGAFAASISPRLRLSFQAGGVYLLGRNASQNAVVFDLSQVPLFKEEPPDDALEIFQRTLRFAIKIWENLRLSVAEKVSAETKHAVLFPFRDHARSAYRVVLERDVSVRAGTPEAGQVLLVFLAGTEDRLGAGISPDTRVASEALAGLAMARRQESVEAAQGQDQNLVVTELVERDGSSLTALPYGAWLKRLTEDQAAFVSRPVLGPERIEGPAGTGKSLCMMLKALSTLKRAATAGAEHHSIFVAHSEATRRAFAEHIAILDEDRFAASSRRDSVRSLTVTTLQTWSAALLGEHMSETELLDRDAMASKEYQVLYVLEALQESKKEDLPSHRPLLSPGLVAFLDGEEEWRIAEMFRHEIAISIKGRSRDDFETYKRLPSIKYNLPVQTDGDKGFVFSVFNRYRAKLASAGHFDTDDVVLSALGHLDTPLWRRRRDREGFDSVFVDETHLFNLNELSLFHHMTRKENCHSIVFAVDRSQAIGDRALSEGSMLEAMVDGRAATADATQTRMDAVFRSAPEILRVAQAVTASGATLFTNFEDPLKGVVSVSTQQEEAKSALPRYRPVGEGEFELQAFKAAERIAGELNCEPSSVAIVCFTQELYKRTAKFARECRKPVELIERRGDIEAVGRAKKTHSFLVSTPDYVGGLEFQGVVLVGVDETRFPPLGSAKTQESRHFVDYAAHNLLYVALTRARFRVDLLGDKTSRPSKMLQSAVQQGLIEVLS